MPQFATIYSSDSCLTNKWLQHQEQFLGIQQINP